MWRKGNPPTLLVGCKLVQPLWKMVWRFFRKLKIELPYDPTIPLLGMYREKTKTLSRKDTCTPMFIALLFTIAKTWKQLKGPSMDEWIKKIHFRCVCVCTCECVYVCVCKMELYSVIKRRNPAICNNMDEPWEFYAKWNKTEKETYCINSLICGI